VRVDHLVAIRGQDVELLAIDVEARVPSCGEYSGPDDDRVPLGRDQLEWLRAEGREALLELPRELEQPFPPPVGAAPGEVGRGLELEVVREVVAAPVAAVEPPEALPDSFRNLRQRSLAPVNGVAAVLLERVALRRDRVVPEDPRHVEQVVGTPRRGPLGVGMVLAAGIEV